MKIANFPSYFEGNLVEGETLLFIGETGEAATLYAPDEILAMTDYREKITYKEGEDFVKVADKLRRTPNSRMPYIPFEEYYNTVPGDAVLTVIPEKCKYKFAETRYVKFGEVTAYTDRQVKVSYTHKDAYAGTKPAGHADKFPRFHEMLKAGKVPTVVFYGDSITAGCNASGTPNGGNIPPYLPPFSALFGDTVKEKFGTAPNVINTAVPGWKSPQGIEAFDERVAAYHPDLLVLGFGMNDGRGTPAEYRAYTETLIRLARENNPQVEILLIATTVPNPETDWSRNQPLFVNETFAIAEGDAHMAVADMTHTHEELIAKKSFAAMTGNGVNHPNDFLVKIYAEVISSAILE